MIQRKQTIYLLISAILMAILPFKALLVLSSQVNNLDLTSLGFEVSGGTTVTELTIGPAILNIIIILISFITIFLFKKRTLQMRLTVFNMLLTLGFIGYIYFTAHLKATTLTDTHISPTPWGALPFVAFILDYLAHRSIAIDDRLVKYMDRLR